MGTGASTNQDSDSDGSEDREDEPGGQLYVSLKMENYKLNGELIPHVYGSLPLVGSWDTSKALSMERESTSMWELSFVVPPNHEALDFKFLLKPKYDNSPCIVEDGSDRLLRGGILQGDARLAVFRINDDIHEYRVFVQADKVSPFDLAASWRTYQENFRPSTVRGIPDVSMNSVTDRVPEDGSSMSLDLDLEQYLVPAPAGSESSGPVYAANMAESPRSYNSPILYNTEEVNSCFDGSNYALPLHKDIVVSTDQRPIIEETEVLVTDSSRSYSSGIVESKSVGAFSSFDKQDVKKGIFVDRGVGSAKLFKSASEANFSSDHNHSLHGRDSEAKVYKPPRIVNK
jgi:6-phosphofructo-2-kinase/fructose-2,6-biphosphatase